MPALTMRNSLSDGASLFRATRKLCNVNGSLRTPVAPAVPQSRRRERFMALEINPNGNLALASTTQRATSRIENAGISIDGTCPDSLDLLLRSVLAEVSCVLGRK
jgi:hypothetical protein